MDGVAVCAAVTDLNLFASGMATAADITHSLYTGHSLGRALEATDWRRQTGGDRLEAAGFEVPGSPNRNRPLDDLPARMTRSHCGAA